MRYTSIEVDGALPVVVREWVFTVQGSPELSGMEQASGHGIYGLREIRDWLRVAGLQDVGTASRVVIASSPMLCC